MSLAPEQTGIGIRRHFTTPGVDPYDQVEWERRDARITDYRDGSVVFEQRNVEVPSTWSVNATNILSQKYFRGTLGTVERETSLRQVVDRVADTITDWGIQGGYFVDDAEAETFRAELKHLIVQQKAAFNSPVWFNIGVKGVPQQGSACQPYDALVSTPDGLVPIGRLVETAAVGTKVFDAHGLTSIVAVKANGRKRVLRIHTKAGHQLDVTPDHLVWRSSGEGTGSFREAGTLKPGDKLEWHRNESWGAGEIRRDDIAEAALAGWLQADGFVGQYDHGTNRSLTAEFMTVTDAEHEWISYYLDTRFPTLHRKDRSFETSAPDLDGHRIRLYGEHLRGFVERWSLLVRGTEMIVPEQLFEAPLPVVAAYLRSVFQADGYVSVRENAAVVGLDLISERLVRGVQQLLARFGIFSRVRRKEDRRPDRHDVWSLAIRPLADRQRFGEEIGFIDWTKGSKLAGSLELPGKTSGDIKRLEIERIEDLGDMEVYDIQTESGEYLSSNLRVHNCFILAVDDTMDSILNWYVEEGTIFKGGSGSGINLSRIRSSKELLKGGGTASGPVSFMRGADASAGTIKSGGKTRRAAKMVILDVDHPDVQEFIWCKAVEERKARVLRDAGFDMDLDGSDSHSIQYQNANNSVRVTDDFMRAVEQDLDWSLTAVTTGEVLQTVRARELFREIARAAWECADPGMQFDTTINRWHTAANTGRINGSNPCFTAETRVHTDKGLIRFGELFDRANRGEEFGIYTHDITNPDSPASQMLVTAPEAFMITGRNPIVRLRFDNGMELRCTPGHKVFTVNRGYVEAQHLTTDDQVRTLDLPTPAVNADWVVPVSADPAEYRQVGDHSGELRLPSTWSEDLGHYLGWLIGDGSTAGATTTTIYGSADDRTEILPTHTELVTWINGDRPLKLSEQANGTAQLRLARRQFKAWLEALGVRSVTGEHKVVPWSIEQAPPAIAAAFLRGLFDADGTVDADIALRASSVELLRGVQRLLTTFGISSTVARSVDDASYDLRITAGSLERFAAEIGFDLSAKAARLAEVISSRVRGPYAVDTTARLLDRSDEGVELTYNLSEPRNHSYVADGIVVRNCSEYMHLDNSACNLASLNLLKFIDEDDEFDVEGYKAAIEVVFTAQEILVGNADYPTEPIAETSRRFRQLGLGYANLGALLMALGLPYDSDAGRAWAGALTALMTGHAYATSARTAARMGPFAGYTENAEHMLRVLRMHRSEAANIDEELVPPMLLSAAQQSWDESVELAEQYGVRNSQSTVLAPTGTISFLMDCDTTGIEPDLGLVKTKKLVGGGTMSIVNQTIPRALARLGYTPFQIDNIVEYIDANMSIVGAPHLKAEHLPVFACSMGDNVIHYMGHVRMMAAAQPFISGAISKCVTGETLLATTDGLVRIDSLHEGEPADSFRPHITEVASLDGNQKTDAFYYGGLRQVREVVLRSGHRVAGTQNHRVLVGTPQGFDWKRLDEIAVGDMVATEYGAELWSTVPARFDDFTPSPRYGSQKAVSIPAEMTEELAYLLGAYAAEGHTSRPTWTIRITNSVPEVRARVVAAWKSEFGLDAKIVDDGVRCPDVLVSSKTVVEFLDHLGSGGRASEKRIPAAVLRSPRHMVLAFLQGLSLDAHVTVSSAPKWAICLDSPALLDDLQSVLANLGVVHSRTSKYNREYDKSYGEVYATGDDARHLVHAVPFLEPDKAERAERLMALRFKPEHNSAHVVPVGPRELHALIPHGYRAEFNFLCDDRTKFVTRHTLQRVASTGASLPAWLRTVLDDGLWFSPVQSVDELGLREVYDVSVPSTHAFVGNGIVNHNTINMPESSTIEDVEDMHMEAWKSGLKAVAIYRDNCKVAQPLSTTKKESDAILAGASAGGAATLAPAQVVERIVEKIIREPVRQKLPRTRTSKTFEFRVADCKGFVTVGEYDDGRPGEIFLRVSKQGSTLAGIMDAFAISISHGLQYGVPLRAFVEVFTNMRFEPAGMTDDPDIRFASSLMDYLFRKLALEYLSYDERAELGIMSVGERLQPTLPGVEETVVETSQGHDIVADPKSIPSASELATQIELGLAPDGPPTGQIPVVPSAPPPMATPPAAPAPQRASDAPICMQCGVQMNRAGSCYACPSCGSTSGCS